MALVPPVQKDGFSYAVDSFYCEASNQKRHRRATIPELKAHFSARGDGVDQPGHWYEAQLLHYDLPASKVKGTAHKRLFDAVSKGNLAVPARIQKVEADLKKEWNKKEREAKKALKECAAAKPTAKNTKRKAETETVGTRIDLNLSLSVNSSGGIGIQARQPAAKKAKTTKSAPKSTTPKKAAPVKAQKTAAKSASPAKPKNAPTKPVKATAKPKPNPKPKPVAGRSGVASASSGFNGYDAYGGGYADGYDSQEGDYADYEDRNDGYYDEPPPYSEYDERHNAVVPGVSGIGGRNNQGLAQPSTPRLGLLNGRYAVSCPQLERAFPRYSTDFGLVATVDGETLWLNFDFGSAQGIMKNPRPWDISDGREGIVWRGHAVDAHGNRRFYNLDVRSRAGPGNSLEFLGGGRIRGSIRYEGRMVYDFEAHRLPGQPMRSEISPAEMRRDWEEMVR